ATGFERSAANHLRPRAGHNFSGELDLVAILHAARPGHDHHLRAADRDIAHAHHRTFRAEAATRQFVGRDDAVRLLDALHHFEHGEVEIVLASHASKDRVDHAGGPMHVEA